jgi:PKD repeat protein
MKKLLLSLFTLFSFFGLLANDGFDVKFTQETATTSKVEFSIGDFNLRSVNINGTDFTKIYFEGRVTTKDKGFAELPFVNANIQLGADNNVSMEIIPGTYTDYPLEYPLLPSRGVIYRDQDPSKIPYEIAHESIIDDFYPANLADITEPFIIKDARGLTVYVYPFRYNAATQTLRVYKGLTVNLTDNNTEPINPLHNTSGKYFREMEGMYQSIFVNYDNQMDDLSMAEAGDILVICTSRDETAIQPYIDWKKEKGFDVQKEVVATGTNVKTLIQQKYNANNDILYVQLVGDWADIKCDIGASANAPMDPMLGCVVGTDYYPDIAIGRFSASSAAQVTIQVDKTIDYEKSTSGSWYKKAIGVASNQGPGDDNELDYEQINVIYNNKLDPFTYNTHSTAYDPTGTASQVAGYINQGAGIINYCGHGSSTSWGSTGFSNTNINSLSNGDMLPFIFSVACVNGAFHNTSDCFAEAWLKKLNGGAVMTLMSTINQPWDPPMRGQDYFNDLLTGGYNYTSNPGNGTNTDEGRTIIGSIVVNGLNLMYAESSGNDDLNTIKTWTIFGDASLQARTDAPGNVTYSNNFIFTGSPFQTTVSVNGSTKEGALVAISQNGVYASAYSGADGSVTIPNTFTPGDVKLVITAFNAATVYETIQSIPPSGPYIVFNEVEVNNASGKLEYGESANLNFALKNEGVENATNVNVTISSTDAFVTITDGTENFGSIEPGEIKMIDDAFAVDVANNVPDGHSILFNFQAVGQETWEGTFSLTASAGFLEYGGFTISDITGNNNGKLDPGETVQVSISIENNGGAGATAVFGELLESDPNITITENSINYGNIAAGGSAQMSFQVTAGASTPAGHQVNFSFNISADKDLSGTSTFIIVVGQIPVLIVDMDDNNNSSPAMATAFDGLGIAYDEVSTMPDNLNLYSSVFVCLGIYSTNTVLSATDGQKLANYLYAGGTVYMEGGDTWYYDTQTIVQEMFGINGTADGTSDLGTINGVSGTFTEGMSFGYSGDNSWIDHLEATGSAEVIFNNQSPAYGCAVANDAGNYKTIGTSFEFGGLGNTDASKEELIEEYLIFFGLIQDGVIANFSANPTQAETGTPINFTDLSVGDVTQWQWEFEGGTPLTSTDQNLTVTWQSAGDFDVTLTVKDNNGNSSTLTKENYISITAPPVVHFTPSWTTPFNPMTFYVFEAAIDGLEMQAGDEIGIFDIDPNNSEEICVGSAKLTGVITIENYLEVIASMDDGSVPGQANGFTVGNQIIYKLWNGASGEITNVAATYPYPEYDEEFASQGTAIVNLSGYITPVEQYVINLPSGWSGISSHIIPANTNIQNVASGIASQLEIIQNMNTFYQPGNGASNLINWDFASGYCIKVNEPVQLIINGNLPENKTIELTTGWNLIPVLSDVPVSIDALLAGKLNSIEIVKDAMGKQMYWPAKDISSLQELLPGHSYLVKAKEFVTITY